MTLGTQRMKGGVTQHKDQSQGLTPGPPQAGLTCARVGCSRCGRQCTQGTGSDTGHWHCDSSPYGVPSGHKEDLHVRRPAPGSPTHPPANQTESEAGGQRCDLHQGRGQPRYHESDLGHMAALPRGQVLVLGITVVHTHPAVWRGGVAFKRTAWDTYTSALFQL